MSRNIQTETIVVSRILLENLENEIERLRLERQLFIDEAKHYMQENRRLQEELRAARKGNGNAD